MMTLEEFKKKAAETDDWAPGWDAVEAVFETLYPGQEPAHFGTALEARAMFGGNEFLDGYSIYGSPNGYKHLVTFGMTHLYVEEEAFGGEWNKWGYEMTIKLPERETKNCMWAISLLSNLARYTYSSERFFGPYQFVQNGGNPIRVDCDTKITALLMVPDTEAEGTDTIYGRTDFIQIVGITEPELQMLKEDHTKAQELAKRMQADNPYLVMDLDREESYLF